MRGREVTRSDANRKKFDVGPGGSEVVVAGGGPTGLWLACELALARVRVTVLERLAEPTGLSKALGLQARSMEMLEYRGIMIASRPATRRRPS